MLLITLGYMKLADLLDRALCCDNIFTAARTLKQFKKNVSHIYIYILQHNENY